MSSTICGKAIGTGQIWETARLENQLRLDLKKIDSDSSAAGKDFFDNRIFHDFAMVADGGHFLFYRDGALVAEFTDGARLHKQGLLGFSMDGSWSNIPGRMVVDDVKVYAAKPLDRKLVAKVPGIVIPAKYNRIHGKLRYDVEIWSEGKGYILIGKASGGPCETDDPAARPLSHQLLNPYVRLESPDGRHSAKLVLHRGTVGNTRLTNHIPLYGPSDISGPVSGELRFAFAPAKCRLAVGYERYTDNTAVAGRSLRADRQSRRWQDPPRGPADAGLNGAVPGFASGQGLDTKPDRSRQLLPPGLQGLPEGQPLFSWRGSLSASARSCCLRRRA